MATECFSSETAEARWPCMISMHIKTMAVVIAEHELTVSFLFLETDSI